ncbi:hypothetical protein EV697_10637 [Bisgaardia hudsonensis]|uniref:Der GTPase-activating protein YihI n=1 Tax=Bisgaardia hudsonensis TaxID=109472 RepID=A0A4R2MUN0_9PAST|nr:Der GTPase-activating protein YihI [Bisgaardia hudsonensis]QLB13832.1 GTPase-activating protein [Bisgaardia hudsonensis]TCP11683.1 hypothetical protein EV697_10637 [Bisgaardia hudsonensis]
MARQKKTRRVTDVMPARKADNQKETPKRLGSKSTRYELDMLAREDKKKKKHKGLASGSRHNVMDTTQNVQSSLNKDPRVGSRKKIPLFVEFINKPEKGMVISSEQKNIKDNILDPMLELEQLENNECLNQLLDDLDNGKKITQDDQKFVDECLERIANLMNELGIEEESEEDLYRTFEKIDINQFK